MSEEKSSVGKVIFWLGAISSCIAIYAFLSGNQSVRDIFAGGNSSPASQEQPSIITNYEEPTPTSIPNIGNLSFLGLADEVFSGISVSSSGSIVVSTDEKSHGVFRSDDSGKTWRAVNNGLGNFNVIRFHVAPQNIDAMLAITFDGMWVTQDGGKHWQLIDDDNNELGIGTFVSANGQKMIANHQYIQTWTSNDGGDSWQMLTDQFGSCTGRIFVSPSDSDYIYCASGEHWVVDVFMFRSRDGGLTWSVPAGIGNGYEPTVIALSPFTPTTLYVGTPENGAFKSTDGADSWIPINSSLPNQGLNLPVYSIAESPINRNYLLLGTEGFGVFFSKDGGDNWIQLEQTDGKVSWVAFHPQNPNLAYITIDESGVYEVPLP